MRTDAKAPEQLLHEMLACSICGGKNYRGLCIDEKQCGIAYSYPKNMPVDVLFVAESPPRPGNGFFYNEKMSSDFRDRLFGYLNESGLGPISSISEFTNKKYFLADTMNCRWNKKRQKKIPKQVFVNCRKYLERQIHLFQPRNIICMGKAAEEAIRAIKSTADISFVEDITVMSFIMTTPIETRDERLDKFRKVAHRLKIPMQNNSVLVETEIGQ